MKPETITEKDDRIEHLENDLRMCVQEKDKQIAELVQRIAELEAQIKEMNDIYTLERMLNHDRNNN